MKRRKHDYVSRAERRWDDAVAVLIEAGKEILRQEVERVFKRHPRLKCYDAYMGTSVFTDADGKIVDDCGSIKIPNLAMEVLRLEGVMCACVGTYSVTWVNKDGKAVEVQREF